MTWLIQGTVASLPWEKLTTNYPVVQAIPLLSLWYLFNSSCAHRSVFLCDSCFQQGSEYAQLDTNMKFESWNIGKVMDLMFSFFYICFALNMSMLVTDCLKFISLISISRSVLSKDRIKCVVWQPSLNLFSTMKTSYFQIWAVWLPPAVSSLITFNKTQFLSYAGNPPPSYMPIDLVTLTYCNLLDWLCNFFELRGICQQYK